MAVTGEVVGDGVNWSQVRTILWARYRIWMRSASKSWWRMFLSAVGVGMLAAAVLGGSTFAAIMVQRAKEGAPDLAPAIPILLFTFAFVTLTITPPMGLRGNEFLDVTKLFLFPVNGRTVFASTIIGLATSPGVLLLTLPMTCASVAYVGASWLAVPAALAALLVAACGLALGHLLLLSWLDLFRSRRWRDFSMVLLSVFGAGSFAGIRLLSANSTGVNWRTGLAATAKFMDRLVFLPSWWGAHVVVGSGFLRFLPALALVPLLWWIVTVAATVQERIYFGEIEEQQQSIGVRRGIPAKLGGLFRGALGAALEKDLALLLRDPAVRIQFVQSLSYSAVPLILSVMNTNGSSPNGPSAIGLGSWAGVAGYFLVMFGCSALAFNPLGTEGAGLAHVLLTPVKRSTILLSKGLAIVFVLGPICGAIAAVAAVIGAATTEGGAAVMIQSGALSFVETICAVLVVVGVGVFSGVFLPIPSAVRDRKALAQSTKRKGGCGRALLGLAAFLVAALSLLPVFAAFRHPMVLRAFDASLDSERWLLLTLPLGIAWSAAFLYVGSRLGGACLASREEQVLTTMTRVNA